MKKMILCALLWGLSVGMTGLFAQNEYYFPEGLTFDASIPSPSDFLGYPIGAWHTRHDQMTAYFEQLAEVSELADFQVIGYSVEHRPQVILTITSPENRADLEAIRTRHLALAQNPDATAETENMPVVVLLGYNVHGNEPSSTEAAMLTAYYLLAARFEGRAETLRHAVIMIDPAYNPDGRDRHTNWVNMHKGNPPVADPLDREHNEVWPRGRTNHYWFDLNRDWLPLAQVESQNRMAFYQQWLPNVATDFHEMGTNSTYFFEPTKPFGSENPRVGRRNYDELNAAFAPYFQRALDDIGALYFSKEAFDNFYPGYGSTYPDMTGGLGLLFEQASSRGHVQASNTKDLTFAYTIRNQVRAGLATVRAAVDN
ncbi:MAG: zinc carboxypeptidase, partial [Bacteroidetes bacterium]